LVNLPTLCAIAFPLVRERAAGFAVCSSTNFAALVGPVHIDCFFLKSSPATVRGNLGGKKTPTRAEQHFGPIVDALSAE
jgi:hypothetical protein